MSGRQGYGYGGAPNPYAQQQETGYNPNDSYGAPNYSQGYNQQGGQGGEKSYSGYEMERLNGPPSQAHDPQAFFQEIGYLRDAIKDINANIDQIESLHQRSLSTIDEGANQQNTSELDAIVARTSQMNRNLANRITALKQKDVNKEPQVGSLDRSFKDTLQRYQRVETQYQKRAREQLARQYRIVNPEASDQEIQDAVENADGPVFSQAVMQNRRGAARSALQEVRSRHAEIQKIERTMVELAQLFEEMNQMVVAQQEYVQQIETGAQNVQENTQEANVQLTSAVKSAAAARRKKWWCLLICILIVIVIAIIIAIVVVVNKKK